MASSDFLVKTAPWVAAMLLALGPMASRAGDLLTKEQHQRMAEARTAGTGSEAIRLLPALSPPALKNGETLTIEVLIRSAHPIEEVRADLGGVETVRLTLDPTSRKALAKGGWVGLWRAEWTAANLEERVYPVALTVTDERGEEITDCSLVFSDPAAGISAVGTFAWPNRGLLQVRTLTGPAGANPAGAAWLDDGTGEAFLATFSDPAEVFRVDTATLTTTGRISLAPDDRFAACAVYDEVNGFAYVGMDTVPARVAKIDMTTFSHVDTLILPGAQRLTSAVLDLTGTSAFFGTYSNPGQIARIDLATFTLDGVLTLDASERNLALALGDPLANLAYFCTDTSPGTVVRVDLASFTRLDAITLNPGEDFLRAGAFDILQDRLLVGSYTFTGRVVTIDPVSFTREDGIALPASPFLHSALYDAATARTFWGSDTAPGIISQVATSPLTFVNALTLNAGENELRSAVGPLAPGKGFYTTNTAPGGLVQVDLPTLARDGAASLPSAAANFKTMLRNAANTEVIAVSSNTPGQVMRMNLDTMEVIETLSMPAGVGLVECGVLDFINNIAYFGTFEAPARIMPLDLNTMTFLPALTLDPGDDRLSSLHFDANGGGRLYGTCFTSPGRVVDVDLTTFTRVGAVDLPVALFDLRTGLYDAFGGMMYAASGTIPSRVARLTTFPLAFDTSVSLPAGANLARSMVRNPAPGTPIVYIGTDTSPGRIVRFDLLGFTAVDVLTLDAGDNFIRSLAATDAGNTLIAGTYTTPGRTIAVDVTGAPMVRTAALDHNGSNNFAAGTVVDDLGRGRIYHAMNTNPGRVVVLNQTNLRTHKATRVDVPTPGYADEMILYSHSAGGNVRVALYDDSEPKQLLWESNVEVNGVSGAEIIVPIASGNPPVLPLLAGTYWLAHQEDLNDQATSFHSLPMGEGFFSVEPFGPFRSTLSNTRIRMSGEGWTQYINYTEETDPPVTLASAAPIQVEGAITGTYVDNGDGAGIGIDFIDLWVREPGGAWTNAGPVTGGVWSFNPTQLLDAADGEYHFTTVSVDLFGNSETVPAGADPGHVVVLYQDTENSNFAWASVTDGTYIFPMTLAHIVELTFSGGAAGGPITVSRQLSPASPPGLLNTRLVRERLTIRGVFTGTAELFWPVDPVNTPPVLGTVDNVFQFEGGVRINTYPVVGPGPDITIPGITFFSPAGSTWHAGNEFMTEKEWRIISE